MAKHILSSLGALFLILLQTQAIQCDLFDGLSSSSSATANAVCLTTEDCLRDRAQADNSQAGPANQKPVVPSNLKLPPLFCQNSSHQQQLECLCNRLQLHTHESSAENSPLTNCLPCSSAATKTSNSANQIILDPCTTLDPYSRCNGSSGHCECSLTSQDSSGSDKLQQQVQEKEGDLSTKSPGSICLHRHLGEHYNFSSGTSAHDHSSFVAPEPLSEWLLSLLLAYLLPGLVILALVWFLYRQGCCSCGCSRRSSSGGRSSSGDDSEMVLYRQL